MTTARDLRNASTRELREQIVHGHPIEPRDLEGWVYRGTSLGLPSAIESFTWKTFQKTFYRDPKSGRLLGWNVRLEQDGIDAPSRPKMRRDGRPVTEWHYEVISPTQEEIPMPEGFDRGLAIDYSRMKNPFGPIRFMKDPLVALQPGSADQLIGVSYAVVLGRCIETPTYFTLEREQRIDYVPFDDDDADEPTKRAAAHPASRALQLTAIERAWAEDLFAAIIPTGKSDDGLPAFTSIDRSTFWRCMDEAPAPIVRAGLRPMVHTLTFLPVVTSGFGGRPFFLLSHADRERFLTTIASRPNTSYFVRQSLVTLKTLACLAYFDDPQARARFERDGNRSP